MPGRLIDAVKPAEAILPEVQPPKQRVPFEQKLLWTLGALLVYLVCSNVPLYGITMSKRSDPFYIMRMILASSRGTLMELGISPIITSGMIMQLLQGAKIIECDISVEEDRRLYSTATKLLGLLITLGEALAYVLSGMYGDVRDLGAITSLLLVLQLSFAGIVMLTLDDLLSKGYGIGGGINLFIVTNICEGFIWRCFSPMTFNVGKGTEFEGAIVAAIHALLFRPNKLAGIHDALFRENLPNLLNVGATLLIFALVIWAQGFHVPFKLGFEKGYSSQNGQPPPDHQVKLFYTSNMPIILLSALVGNVYFFSQVLFSRFPANPLIRLFGRWSERTAENPNSRPVGGLSYYISPPTSFADLVADPFHALFYIAFMMAACALFAKVWIEISGTGWSSVKRQFEDSHVVLKNPRDRERIKRHIPTAAAFGAMCVAALSISADLLGAIGSGTGILMAVTIIYDLFEKVAKDIQAEAAADPSNPKWAQMRAMLPALKKD